MVGFPQTTQIKQDMTKRISQQSIVSKTIKPTQLSQQTLQNSSTEILGPLSVNTGDSISVISIVSNTVNPLFRIGTLPYAIAFFEGTLNVANIIGAGPQGYVINGPMAMPQFTPYAEGASAGGNNGVNLVFVTELVNNTGMTKTIYVITDSRVYFPISGSPEGRGTNL